MRGCSISACSQPGNKGSGDDLLAGMQLAVRSRYRVINMSLAASAKFVPELRVSCEHADDQDQVVVPHAVTCRSRMMGFRRSLPR